MSAADPLIGRVVDGQLEVSARLGEGGMGVVYLARHRGLDTEVAVKVLHDHLAAVPEIAARFEREARAAAKLDNPHAVKILDVLSAEGRKLLVLERLTGESLRARIDRERLPPARAIEVALQLLEALAEAHERGIVHRDLKPENVMLLPDAARGVGFVKILDFGIASLASDPRLTETGQALGTPAYMAPEHARGEPIGPAADLYAVTALWFEMLTGAPPFEADTVAKTLQLHLHAPIPRLAERGVRNAERLQPIVDRGLAKDPAQRFPSAAAMADAIVAVVPARARAASRMAPARPRGGWLLSPSSARREVLESLSLAALLALSGARLLLSGGGPSRAIGAVLVLGAALTVLRPAWLRWPAALALALLAVRGPSPLLALASAYFLVRAWAARR